MAPSRLRRQGIFPTNFKLKLELPKLGFVPKLLLAILVGLSFSLLWSFFSSSSAASDISSERSSFASDVSNNPPPLFRNFTSLRPPPNPRPRSGTPKPKPSPLQSQPESKSKPDPEPEHSAEDSDPEKQPQQDSDEEDEDTKEEEAAKGNSPPVFDLAAKYHWKQCGSKSGHGYIPCVDFENDGSQRHHDRSCPKSPGAMSCLVSPPNGYHIPERWPERASKVWYANVVHPRLSEYVKKHSWLRRSGEYLVFPEGDDEDEASEFKGAIANYVNSMDEMVPDIEWGKNVRVILDIGCESGGGAFGAMLAEKEALVLSLGLMTDQVNLAQLVLERGVPAVVGSLGSRRLPFPSGVFDAIHCGDCSIAWHSNGGKLLLEMNRILRPGGFFIISGKHSDIASEEGMSKLVLSICWNVVAHKSEDSGDLSVKVYQRPSSNELYELRPSRDPPFCKEDDNHDIAWYTSIKRCVYKVPVALEERGSDWPEEWPKRLDTFPDWIGDLRSRVNADREHWKAIIEKTYLSGMGIDWANIRNVMDMSAGFGGFAAALTSRKVWVMNVVPVHAAADTLPIIFERGLLGIYHDWCEPFGTYPRSYDLLHANHLFSHRPLSTSGHLGRCKHPPGIVAVAEMDRILRPGGWAIVRDSLDVTAPLEDILRALHWDIRMTYAHDGKGILCAQKRLVRNATAA